MKIQLIATYFALWGICASAQSNNFASVVHIGGGIGYSQFGLFSKALELGSDGQFSETKVYPAYTGYFDYQMHRRFSIGVSGGYQSLQQRVDDFTYDLDGEQQTVESFYYRLNRTNAGIHFRVHYSDDEALDIYSGMKIGVSIFKLQFDVNDAALLSELENRADVALSTPSFQFILCGLRYYPVPVLGIHFELGLGAPAFVSSGISFRIPTTSTTRDSTLD